MGERTIAVEVVYALPRQQTVLKIEVPQGTTLRQAVDRSGILQKFPEIDPETMKTGIYGKLAKPDTPLQDFDRVEIYRPLIANPKTVHKKGSADVPEGAGA